MTNNPMTNKKQLLVAAGLAALSSGVLAEALDERVYLNLGLSYTFTDDDRDISFPGFPTVEVENAPGGFIGVGKAINDWLNLELNLKGQHADLDGAGGAGSSTEPPSTDCSFSTAPPPLRRSRCSVPACCSLT